MNLKLKVTLHYQDVEITDSVVRVGDVTDTRVGQPEESGRESGVQAGQN
jgi:hypothetical protein